MCDAHLQEQLHDVQLPLDRAKMELGMHNRVFKEHETANEIVVGSLKMEIEALQAALHENMNEQEGLEASAWRWAMCAEDKHGRASCKRHANSAWHIYKQITRSRWKSCDCAIRRGLRDTRTIHVLIVSVELLTIPCTNETWR